MSRQPRVTIRDVASLAGVSPSAVSHVFNGRDDIGAATRERIITAARQLNWSPAASASALAAARTRTFGYVVVRDPNRVRSDPFFVDVIAGVQGALAAHQHNLLVRIAADRDEELETYRSLSQRRQIDGFFLVDHQANDARYPIIQAAGLTAVAIGRPYPGCPFPSVSSDPDDPGLADAIATLARLGHRRLAYVGGPERFAHAAFRRERVERAAAAVKGTLTIRDSEYTEDAVAAVTTELLSTPDRPTAIIYNNDWLALWAMAAAERLGLSVPTDVSIVGHDDAPFAAHARPSLSTVHEDVVAIADGAARLLLASTMGQPVPATLAPPTQFIARASIASPPPSPPTQAT